MTVAQPVCGRTQRLFLLGPQKTESRGRSLQAPTAQLCFAGQSALRPTKQQTKTGLVIIDGLRALGSFPAVVRTLLCFCDQSGGVFRPSSPLTCPGMKILSGGEKTKVERYSGLLASKDQITQLRAPNSDCACNYLLSAHNSTFSHHIIVIMYFLTQVVINNVHLSCAHQRPERSHDTY